MRVSGEGRESKFGCGIGFGRRTDRSWWRECAGSQPGDGVGKCRIAMRERERTGRGNRKVRQGEASGGIRPGG